MFPGLINYAIDCNGIDYLIQTRTLLSNWLITDTDKERTLSSTVLGDKHVVAFVEASKAIDTG